MPFFNIVAETDENTVVTEYKSLPKDKTKHESEAEMEANFIKQLQSQGYEYRPDIKDTESMKKNLRVQLEKLNSVTFTDAEWKRFFDTYIANANDGILEKSKTIQEDFVKSFKFDDGTPANISLIDKKNVHNNFLQVINQFKISTDEGAKHDNRYDVTILVNGLPLVHIELKKRGVNIREAFNQINRYGRDSFSAGAGFFDYVQIFVISNGTYTKYYSNTTRENHIKQQSKSAKKKKTSNSFEFTSFWADSNNKVIPDIIDFTSTFFAKHTILNILAKYCVFTSENMLLVMRPYQITATERIINRINISTTYKKYGGIEGGGYIWHTTGSGKTLTSFKTARIASNIDGVDKVLFVVDRKDLDYQTMREYDRFEKGCANSNTSTNVLKKQLEDPNSKIIITTIQKLSTFIKKNPNHEVYNKHIVLIFDECHRSQFGDMHASIVKNFKKYHIFGFTGTPIFAANAGKGKTPSFLTTAQAFGDQLHTYTIVDAIADNNVLPFKVEYHSTLKKKDDVVDEEVWNIDKEGAYMSPKRISIVTEYIINNFEKKTYRDKHYEFSVLQNIAEVAKNSSVKENKQKTVQKGFNSIFCVASVSMAKLYYAEFKKQLAANPSKQLKIATIFSYAANEDIESDLMDDEDLDGTVDLDQSSRDFLEDAIKDYNAMFGTSYDTSSDKFQNYYKDVSLRMKNKELDLLIVVNMFLTGFDATTLNTLWVDKRLKNHGLIQAFSRTNRILNSVKNHGNIVCFRNLQKQVDSAIALFGDREAGGIVLIKSFDAYYNGFIDDEGKSNPGYRDLITELQAQFPSDNPVIKSEEKKKQFVKLFGAVLRMRNLLSSFDEFEGKEILEIGEFQDYCGMYQEIYEEFRPDKHDDTKIDDDLVFEIELLKQVDINIDYILFLVQQYHDSNNEDKEILVNINRAIDASPELRSKKQLITNFIDSANTVDNVVEAWHDYIRDEKEKEIAEIIATEKLKESETRAFIDKAFENGEVITTGDEIDKLMPPAPLFGIPGETRIEKKASIIEKLKAFFEKFFGVE